MAAIVYLFGVMTTSLCAVLLLRGYVTRGQRLLLWSGLCFVGLAISNCLVFADLVLFPRIDLYFWRLLTSAASMAILVFGLVWEGD